MLNRHPNLIPQTTQWNHLPTKALRVPECFVEEIKAYALALDQGQTDEPQTPNPHTWLGIKPSISNLGWAILDGDSYQVHPTDFGLIQTYSDQPLPERLAEIEDDLRTLITQFAPAHVAVEKPFVNPEYPSTSKLLQVLGVINCAVYRYHRNLPVMLYPATWKSNLDEPTANRADLAGILEYLFDLEGLRISHEVDAIAIAYAAWCGLGSRDSY